MGEFTLYRCPNCEDLLHLDPSRAVVFCRECGHEQSEDDYLEEHF